MIELDERQVDRAQLEKLRDLLDEHYTSVIDLSRLREDPHPQPLSDLERIARRHEGTFTDVLVFRLPAAEPALT